MDGFNEVVEKACSDFVAALDTPMCINFKN